MQLELSAEDKTLLTQVLESALKELRVEVRRTDTRSLHDELQRDEARIRGLLDQLRGEPAAS
jgi:hypothetical protein